MSTTIERIKDLERLSDEELDECQSIIDHLHRNHELDHRHHRLLQALIGGYDAAWETIRRTGGVEHG